jgi:MYXO-CTERM domain-containing protein
MLFALICSASAYDSPDQDVHFEDEVDLYEGVEYDSGWVPSGSPIALRFRVVSEGAASVDMEGVSWLYWPPALTHGYTPEAESGLFLLDSEVGIAADFLVDTGGYYSESTIFEDINVYDGLVWFDPWLFEDQETNLVEIASEGARGELFNFDFDILQVLTAYVAVDSRTDARASFQGERITTNELVVDTTVHEEVFEAPAGDVLELESTFTGTYGAGLDIVFIPVFGVCGDFIGCIDLAEFELPIALVDSEFEQDFEPVYLEHDLPLAVVDTTECDFGEVLVGQIATCEVTLANWGQLPLEGTAGILGAGEFEVFPGDVYANADLADGLTVTFSPSVEGEQTASLILNTSDPGNEALEIPLIGTGYLEEEELPTISAEVGTCGCTSTPTRGSLAGLVALLGLVALRRRG